MVEDIDWGKRLVRPLEHSLAYQQSHQVVNWEDLGKGNGGFCLQNISFTLVYFFYIL
jgi:hypothetical protein